MLEREINRVLCIGRKASHLRTVVDNNATLKPPSGQSANKVLMAAQCQQSSDGDKMVETSSALWHVQFCFQWILTKHALLEEAEYGNNMDTVKQALDQHEKDHEEIINLKTEVDKFLTDRKKLTLEEQQQYEKCLSHIQHMYPVLCKLSQKRREWLVSLQEFLHETTDEMIWIEEKQVLLCEFGQRLDEFSISDKQMYKTLVKEIANRKSQIKSVEDKGYAMIIDKHPATETVEMYISKTESRWTWLQQLLNALAKHIHDICAYHQFFHEVQSCEQWINQQMEIVNNCMKREKIPFKELEEMKIECQDLQNELVKYEERVAFHSKTSHDIIPLKQRNHQVTSPVKVYSLCVSEHPKISLELNEECILQDTSQKSFWVVTNSHGEKVTVPSICMVIPPPNHEAISLADRLKSMLEQLKILVKTYDRKLTENMVMSTIKFIKTWDLGKVFEDLYRRCFDNATLEDENTDNQAEDTRKARKVQEWQENGDNATLEDENTDNQAEDTRKARKVQEWQENGDNATLEDENTDNQAEDTRKARKVQEWQENGDNATLEDENTDNQAEDTRKARKVQEWQENGDSATLEDENTDNQAKDKTSSSVSSNPEKESDFVEVQEWQENDGNNCTLPLCIKYKRAPDKKIIKCMRNIPCSWNFHLYWNFYTKTEPGKQMLHEILNKYNCSVAVFAEDEDLFLFEISEKIFEQESDVVQLIHVVLDSVHKCAQQFLYLDNILVDQRIQGDVLQVVRQRKELDIARFELMGQQDFDALSVVCTEKDQTLVLHVVTEIIHMVKECFENHEETIHVDHKWQKVMKTFGYLQKLCEKYPSVTIISDKTEIAIMLKGPRDQSKPAADHFLELLRTASSEVQEEIFSPGCQFEIFTYPEMCGYIDNITKELSIVWIPNQQTKKIYLFSKKSEKIKGVDKLIRGCVQERLYPLAKDQTVFSTKIIRSLEELKKMHTGKIMFSSSHKGLLLTAADDIFESIDDAVQEIICKETELQISSVHKEAEADRTKTKIAERGQFPRQSNQNEDRADTTILPKFETAIAGGIVKKASDMGQLDALVKEIKEKSGVEVITVGNQVCLKGVTATQMQIAQSCLEEFCEVNLHILLRQGRKITSPVCSQDGGYLANKIEGVSEIEFKALKILIDDMNAKSIDVVWKDGAILITTQLESISEIIQTLNIELKALRGRQMEEIFLDEDYKNVVRDVIAEVQSKDAICVYDEEKSQVVMYCVRLDHIMKFKHKLKFKSGKLKQTGWSNKRFVQDTQSMEASQETASSSVRPAVIRHKFSWSKNASSVKIFYTKEKIKVAVYTADVLNLPVDCIVNTANDRMQHGGGVAKVIADAAGPELVQEGDAIIMKMGRIPVGCQVTTTAGKLPYRCIIHTVGPCWSDYQPHDLQKVKQCEEDLYAAIYGCFVEAEKNGLSTVALPADSSGMYAVPQEMCAVLYAKAVFDYSTKSEQGKSLTEIHFIDKLPHLVKLMQDTFRSMIKNGNVPNYNIQNYVTSSSNYQQLQSKETGRKGHKDGDKAEKSSQYETTKLGGLFPIYYESVEHKKKYFVFQISAKPVVRVYDGNILKLQNMDAIVCPDDTKGSGKEAIASELRRKHKYRQQKENCFKLEKPEIGDVAISFGKEHPFDVIVHVVIESDSHQKPEFKRTMEKSFDNILRKTNEWVKVKTLAMPLFGMKNVSLEKPWAELFLDRFAAFCYEVQNPNLAEIHIITPVSSSSAYSTLKDVFCDFAAQIKSAQHLKLPPNSDSKV